MQNMRLLLAALAAFKAVTAQISVRGAVNALHGSDAQSAEWRPKPPSIHFTPPCFRALPPHDIAAVLFDDQSSTWYLWVGCWSKGGWQLLTSQDLVNWRLRGPPTKLKPNGGMGTGSAMRDPKNNATIIMADNVFAWTGGTPGSPAGSNPDEWPTAFGSVNGHPIARPCSPTNPRDCGDAPTIWFDERVSRYMLLAQFGHRMPGTKSGYGSAYLSSASNLAGPWKQEALPWLEQRGPLPLRGYPCTYIRANPNPNPNPNLDPNLDPNPNPDPNPNTNPNPNANANPN